MIGFGYTERPPGIPYGLQVWREHLQGFLDALALTEVRIVSNSFGGSLATSAPDRVDRQVPMGSVGVPFDITPGLEAVWGFEPSLQAMQQLLDIFTYDSVP